MLSENLLLMIAAQHTHERQNQAVYTALSLAADVAVWPGMSVFFDKAAGEEGKHAEALAEYLIDRGASPGMDALQAVNLPDASPPVMLDAALEVERQNTAALIALYSAAETDGDPQTCAFLLPLLAEQTRSERELSDWATRFRRCSADGWTLLDDEIGL
jgi:ferritin